MSAWGSIGPGTRVLILTLVGGALAGTGYLMWRTAKPVETTLTTEEAAGPAEPSIWPEAGADIAATPTAEPEQGVASILPKIDTWRVALDGEALVAGLALPDAAVQVVVDDLPVAEGVALASGEFVIQFTLPPNPAPSLLWLSMTSPEGTPITSLEMVAIAPITRPKSLVADLEPQSEPRPEVSTENVAGVAPEPELESDVAADAAPTTLFLNEGGATLLQGEGADPALAKQVMIDTISYSPSGAVQIGGRGDADAGVRLYLDNAEVASTIVAADSLWQVTLGDTAPGIYTLRVDQMDATGKVTSRFEIPFKRETREALALAAGSGQAGAPVATGSVAPDIATAAAPDTNPITQELAPDTAAETPVEVAMAAEPSTATDAASAPQPPVTITVQPGFTLWGIAQERFGDGVFYVQVFEANRDKIKDPNQIYPGQIFSIPAGRSP